MKLFWLNIHHSKVLQILHEAIVINLLIAQAQKDYLVIKAKDIYKRRLSSEIQKQGFLNPEHWSWVDYFDGHVCKAL